MFPDRAPGVGLALLRVALALQVHGSLPATQGWQPALTAATVVMLLCGGLLPLAVLLALLLAGLAAGGPLWSAVLLALALLLLGPGAYSLDARLFGRRVISRRLRAPRGPPSKE